MSDFNDLYQRHGAAAVKATLGKAAPPNESLESAVKRLSALSPLAYEQVRKDEAAKLGIERLSVLDQEVSKARKPADSPHNTLEQEELEPWPDPVDGRALFDALVAAFKRYVVLQRYQAETLALWCIFSHAFEASNIAPKLLIHSPEKRCGKTTLLDVLVNLVWKPLPASNISPAVIYRVIEHIGGTIMIDEADTFIRNNPELGGIINSAHRKSMAFVLRCDGDDHAPRKFSTWAPNVIAMIGKPQDTIIDRSILIEMKRKKPGDSVERFIPHKAEAALHILARKIARWAADHFITLCESDPYTPGDLHDRAADNWRPLLAIADAIDAECGRLARLAALHLTQNHEDEEHRSIGTALLADIQEIFESERAERIFTADLLHALHEMEERPWAEWSHGRALSSRQLSQKLKPYGIAPKTMRIGHRNQKGYERSQFTDAFARYLTTTATPSVTASQPPDSNA